MTRNDLVCTAALLAAALALPVRAAEETPAPQAAPAEAPAQPASGPATYKLQPTRSQVYMTMMKAPSLASAFSHDHAFRAPDVAGEIVYDPAAPEQAKVKVAVKTATIVADEPASRQRFKLEGEPSERDKKTIDEDMKSEEFLWVEKHPEVTFTSTGVKTGEGGKLVVSGDFTLRGVTKPVTLPVEVKLNGDVLTGDGKLVIKQTDYGFSPCNKLLGAVKCANEVTLYLHLVGKR